MSIERNDSFLRPFQDKLLAHVVRHPRLLSLAVNGKFKEEDWDLPIQRAVLKAAQNVVRVQGGNIQHAVPETAIMEQLMAMVKIGGIQQAEIPALAELVANIYTEELAPEYFYGMAEQFIYHQRFHAELNEVTQHTLPDLHSRLSKIALDSRIDEAEPIMPLMEMQMDEPTLCIPTGIESIDIAMNGGLPLKEIGMICAFTGVGKTALGMNFLWGGANQGFQTRFATLELSGKKCAQRLYANIGDFSYNRILYGDHGGQNYDTIKREVWERVKRNCEGRDNNLQIWDFHKERCSIQKLRDWLHRDQDRQVKKDLPPPHMLFLDWLLLLDEDPGFDPRKLSDKEMRHKIQRHMDQLSHFVAQENIALWVATQADQKAENKAMVTISNAAEAKSSAWRVYLFAGVGMSAEDRTANPPKATFNACKTRDLRQFNVPLWSELDKQRFRTYPNQAAASQMEMEDAVGTGGDPLLADMIAAAERRQQLQQQPINN